VSADGVRVGAVKRVLGDIARDIFHGVVIDTGRGRGGRRSVAASQVASIFEDRIVLTVPAARVRGLPAPAR
jgi:uncharacterized protein YrrD